VPPDFRGKTVLVTGVGRVGQVGHAVAAAFGRAGASLVIVDRDAGMLEERVKELAAQGVTVRGSAGDLTVPGTASRAVAVATEQLGGLDALVNVAGGFDYGAIVDVTPETFERELAINVKTAFYTSQAAVPALVARGGGAIVNFASLTVLKPEARMAPYIAAKSAVAGLTRAMASELADSGIRVNAVAPGTMRTADNLAHMKDAKLRWVELADLVSAVLFLAGDEAKGISGEVVPVTGGGR
jgi:NAD(P)-dependent dehydrogenase (short-subunit alcohol dehydrogenase family)